MRTPRTTPRVIGLAPIALCRLLLAGGGQDGDSGSPTSPPVRSPQPPGLHPVTKGVIVPLKIPMRFLAAVGFALSLGACGSDSGSTSAPPASPTTPTPPPAPPEPPSQPTGIRMTDRGEDFVEWSWDPVEGATSYEGHAFLLATPPDERPPLETVAEPTFRADGLEPGAAYAFFVRAVRETAGGRAESEWSGTGALTLAPDFPPPACSTERQLALDWEQNPILVPAWDPEQPFRVWIDEGPIRDGGNQIDRPDFLEEEVLEPLRDVADRIEERLGYAIFDPYDLLDSPPSTGETVIAVHVTEDRDRDTPWDPECAPVTISPMNAIPWTAEMVYNEPFFDPAVTCLGFTENRTDETIIHELGHIFGMKHARSSGDANSRTRGGVFMSEPLTWFASYDDSDVFLLQEDIDAWGCMFPHPDHPR